MSLKTKVLNYLKKKNWRKASSRNWKKQDMLQWQGRGGGEIDKTNAIRKLDYQDEMKVGVWKLSG